MRTKTPAFYTAAIVGLGRIGVTLEDDPLRPKPCSHIGAFRSHPRVRVVAGCDTDVRKRDSFRRRWNVRATYADHREMLAAEKIDILSVATWTDSHERIVIDAAGSGTVRAVLCEKPVSLTLAGADAMIRACRKANVLLVVNHERRFEDRYRLAKRIVDAGRLGTLRTIVANVLTNVPLGRKSFEINATSLLHDGTHLIDIIRFLAGETSWVEGFIHERHREAVTALMRLTNGAAVFLETGGLRRYFNFELDLQGTDGRLLIGNTHMKLYRRRRSRHYSKFWELGRVPLPSYPRVPFFKKEIEEIVDRLDGRRKTVESTGLDGREALRIIEAIFRSATSGGRRVSLSGSRGPALPEKS